MDNYELIKKCENECRDQFKIVEDLCEKNSFKVLYEF